jgi:HlyD family secretion protein
MIKHTNVDAQTGPALTRPARTSHFARWLIAVTFLGVFALAGLVWFLTSPSPVAVYTAAPVVQDLESSVSTVGRVVPEHDFLARASFPALIENIDVRLGQNVRVGQMLVRLKDPYASTRVASAAANLQSNEATSENMQQGGTQEDRIVLQTDLARAQAEKASSERSLATLKSLQEGGAASGAEVHAAELRLQATDQTLQFVTRRISDRYSPRDVASWSAKVAEARSNLSAAKTSFSNVNIASPIAGTVYLIPISGNDFVSTGAELVRVADLSQLQVRASFDEQDIGKLHDGAAVIVHWEGKPEREWHGRIEHAPIAAEIAGTRSIGECIITISDARSDLPPNTSVAVRVTVDRRRHVLTLPREALHSEDHVSFVYRIDKDKLTRTPVRVGLLNLDWWEIVAGVHQGDHVALHATDSRDLFDGMIVKALP